MTGGGRDECLRTAEAAGRGEATGAELAAAPLREERNLSQQELGELITLKAAELGINVACDEKRVGRWERGEVTWPSPVYRRVLCAFFGVGSATELGFRRPVRMVVYQPGD